MDIMSKIGVAPIKAIKGQTGLYFKFAEGVSPSEKPIELYFKPKFTSADFEVAEGLLKKITWMEFNVLWVGSETFPNFENGWKRERDGLYQTKEGQKLKGHLIGKLFFPMGEFNDNMPAMHQWLADHIETVSEYLSTKLLPQVQGVVYMPLKTIFNHMLENLQQESLVLGAPEIMHHGEFFNYQKGLAAAASAKYQDNEED